LQRRLVMKATKLLEQQHRQVEQLFARIESGESRLLTELADALAGHMAIEQEIFYPAVHALESDRVSESFEEHSIAELALRRALRTQPNDDQFKARVKVLKELIEHHVEEEEQGLFPAVEKQLSAEALETLGGQMSERFEQVRADGHAAVLPDDFDETTADAALDELEADEDAEEAEATGEDDVDDAAGDESGADGETRSSSGGQRKARKSPARAGTAAQRR